MSDLIKKLKEKKKDSVQTTPDQKTREQKQKADKIFENVADLNDRFHRARHMDKDGN